MDDLVWIAVPHRLLPPDDPAGGGLRRPAVVRVVVVPRLEGSIDDWIADWPVTLRGLRFRLLTRTGDGVRPTVTAPRLHEPVADVAVWRAVFRGDAAVAFNRGRSRQQRAEQPQTQYNDAVRISGDYRSATAQLAAPVVDATGFHDRYIRQWATAPPPPPPPAQTPPSNVIDFNRAYGLLREHPEVMRDLGLIFELLVDAAELEDGDRLSVRLATPVVPVASPWTAYELDPTGFWPAAAPPGPGRRLVVGRGIVDLAGVQRVDKVQRKRPEWAVATFDVDGGVVDLRAAWLLGQREPWLPHLRSSGLMLIRPDRQRDLDERTGTNAGLTQGDADDGVLTADELVLGIRVDICAGHDDAGRQVWRSLCDREIDYRVLDGDTTIPVATGRGRVEEGHVKAFAAVRDQTGALRADEIVVRWDGWSLVVPPPRLAGEPEDPFDGAAGGVAPYSLNWDFTVPPGSLPRLRFGRSYLMRLRVADIAGGGPARSDLPDGVGASDAIAYRRHEPVSPPLLHLDRSLLPGAAVNRLVIRSDRGMTTAEFLAANPRYVDVDECTLYPPPVTFRLAEQHGVFEAGTADASWRHASRALTSTPGDHPQASLPDPAASGVAAHVDSQSVAQTWGDWPYDVDGGGMVAKRLRVDAEPVGDAAVSIEWVGRELHVGLAQGREARVELSSTVTQGFLHHFAVYEWLAEQPLAAGAITAEESYRGRHPLLSPPVVVEVVHAVKRPLTDPVWRLPPDAVQRVEHDTSATLTPQFAGGVDTGSTGRLEVAADWDEHADGDVEAVTVERVHDEPVGPDATQLRFVHQFGDTKHRDVTYTLKAVSRYRGYFAPDEPETAFHAVRRQDTVVIPSTARPPEPVVVGVRPAFRWQTQESATRIVRRRLGSRVSVELARPWFVTGAGETLAVVTAVGAVPDSQAHLVTQLARDPILASPPIRRFPPGAWFGAAPVAEVEPRTGLDVAVVPCPVALDGELWRADVTVTGDVTSYRPFIQLAVARYQPDSLAGLALSPVVSTDPVPLLPDREITVSRGGDGTLEVRVRGVNPAPPNRVVVGLDEAFDVGSAFDAASTVLDDGRLWQPVAGTERVGDASGAPLVLPLPSPGSGRPLRLRIREIEPIPTLPVESPHTEPVELYERTILVDHVPIPTTWQ